MDALRVNQFIEILKHKSIGKAAKSLNLLQSTLSKMLKSLEEEMGCQIYIHNDKSFKLTPFGEALSEYIQQHALLDQQLKDKINNMIDAPHGKLNVITTNG